MNNNKSSEKSEDLFFKVKICIFANMERIDSFNLFEKDLYGYFYTNLQDNKDTFFASNKYSGMYPSEILDIKVGNDKPKVRMMWRW